ncbi:sprouty-related, EVH1 domain-containing protein 1 [Melitaea cinxia]|uniref:sprouty-related, EVH1 domain-containing protein 1 n=1 Tax=Melitaea cinxia TaxID=113334 RepID=UPI001E26F4E8|nr:sprouty-related, EVH1 domain-containing protein 1 [Melitaea cinxia]
MTEASENDYLVRVRAQVMCRDEGTGGWMALGGGGLADVMVCRRGPGSTESTSETSQSHNGAKVSQTEYYIHGRRISDNMLVLDCTVKDDFQYHKVMPTFHHWVSDEKKFGLTFQTAADARAFDKGVRIAVNDLYRLGGAWPTMYGYEEKKTEMKPKEDDEENIFEVSSCSKFTIKYHIITAVLKILLTLYSRPYLSVSLSSQLYVILAKLFMLLHLKIINLNEWK